MDTDKDHERLSIEELAKVAHVADFVIYLVRSVSDHLARLCENLESLPNVFTTLGVAEVVSDAMDSMRASGGLVTKIMPSSKLCGEEMSRKFWGLHSALIFYHYDALMLLRHSMLSAFTGYYSVAFTELRNAMESIVRGVIFDLLAIPKYRRNAKELQKVKGFRGEPGFTELLRILEEELGDKRPEISLEIFDIIDEKLNKFNPEASFIKLLIQLRDWDIVDNELIKDMDSYYTELSKRSHRVHPRFSETGIRAVTQRDWLDLEPVPEELFIYLQYFIDLNGLFTYLTLKMFSIDLVRDDFKNCINWSELDKEMKQVSKLAQNYRFWKRVKQLMNELRQI